MRWRPRLRTVLLTVTLLILMLPLAGVAILRLYENALIERTEWQLLVQGALIGETFRQEYLRQYAARPNREGGAPLPGRPLPEDWRPDDDPQGQIGLQPLQPRLNISVDRVGPPAPDPAPAEREAEPLALQAGRRLTEVLREAARTTLSGIRVVDSGGIVVASSRGEIGLSLAGRQEVARALEGQRVSLLRQRISDEKPPPLRSLSRGQRYRVFVALPIVEDGRVIGAVALSRTPLDVAKALYLNRRALAFLAAAVLVVALAVSMLTSLTISRPVRALIRQAGAISRGETEIVSPPSAATYELAQLSEALASMSRALADRADYIRTFASHVSHEFKTPLTTLRGTVELLRDHGPAMDPQQRERFLDNLDDAAARLQRLVGRLMQQARADVHEPGDERCDVAPVLEAVRRRYADGGPDLSIDAGPRAGRARMAPDMLEEILCGLVDNARQHGGESVRVTLTARKVQEPSGPRIELRVSDDGPGVSEANAGKVFTPFFTTARERGGSGLGLSIVRSLLRAHHGTIELAPTRPGATFVIRLPA